MRIIDLTRTLVAGMPVFPGDAPPEIVRTADFALPAKIQAEAAPARVLARLPL